MKYVKSFKLNANMQYNISLTDTQRLYRKLVDGLLMLFFRELIDDVQIIIL